jgi:hypothetical protein
MKIFNNEFVFLKTKTTIIALFFLGIVNVGGKKPMKRNGLHQGL